MVRLAKLLASSSEPFALSYPIPNFTKSGWAMAALNALVRSWPNSEDWARAS